MRESLNERAAGHLPKTCWAALNYADLRVRGSATSRDSEHVFCVCRWAFHTLGPHTAVTHPPANGIIKEQGRGPGLSQSRQLKAPFMCGPARPGCGEKRKGDGWPRTRSADTRPCSYLGHSEGVGSRRTESRGTESRKNVP